MSDSVESMDTGTMNSVSSINFHDPNIVHDRVLLVEDQKFYVQSTVLSAFSDYFQVMFNSNFKEKNEVEIELKEVSADEFKVFLQVIYPEDFNIQVSQLESLIDMSYRFAAPKVLEICKKWIDKEFNNLEKIFLFELANKPGLEDLKAKALNIIMKCAEYYSKTKLVELLEFAFEHGLEDLKKNLQSVIYTAERQRSFYKCTDCPDRIQEKTCIHRKQKSKPIFRNSLISQFIDEITELPAEIQNFVLRATIDYEL